MPWRHQFSPVVAVEGPGREGPVELGPALRHLGLEAVEHALRQAPGVGFGLHHERRHRTDQDGFRDAALTVPGDVAHHLAPTCRVADVHGVMQIEVLGHRGQVVGVVIHVVTIASLSGAAVPAPVVGDDTIAVLQEEQHLGVPVVSRQRPAVAEDEGLARTPVLVEDLRAISRGDRPHALASVWSG
jgi:hypothetical protein